MKKRIAILISTVLFCICAVLGMAGCNPGGQNGYEKEYPVVVRYYFNEGKIPSYSSKDCLDVRYKTNSLIAKPGVHDMAFPALQRSGYYVSGWYYAEEKDGKVVTYQGEDGKEYAKSSGREFDFKTRVSKSITLVPGWSHNISVLFKNLDYSMTTGADGEPVYKEYSNVKTENETIKKPSFEKTKRGAWVRGYYWDEGLTEMVLFGENGIPFAELESRATGLTETDAEENLILPVYTKFYSVQVVFIDPSLPVENEYTTVVGAGETLSIPKEHPLFAGKSEYYRSYSKATKTFSDAVDLQDGAAFYDLTALLSNRPTLSSDRNSMVLNIYLK